MRQIFKNAGAIFVASTIALGLSGMSHAAGAGDQVGEHGSMAGQGGPVSKQDRSATGQTNQTNQTDQIGSVKPKDAQREKLEERVIKEREQDRQHTLDPSQHTPNK